MVSCGVKAAALLLALAAACPARAETIVMIRHAEKPPGGLGQLNCQGLNRALALPAVIARTFGKPAAIFAPDPGKTKIDDGHAYNYVRPLATIEPTAIAFGLPVDTSIGVDDWSGLVKRIDTPAYRDALVLVAWEHSDIVKVARALLTAHGADASTVPDWGHDDFDSIYVVTVTPAGASFAAKREGLNGLAVTCPT